MRFAVLTALFVFVSAVCASPVYVKARHNQLADLAILKRWPSSMQGLSAGARFSKRSVVERDPESEWNKLYADKKNTPLRGGDSTDSEDIPTEFTIPDTSPPLILGRIRPHNRKIKFDSALIHDAQVTVSRNNGGKAITFLQQQISQPERDVFYIYAKPSGS